MAQRPRVYDESTESETTESLPVPDGQERLATQLERDYINEKIADSSSDPAS